MPERLTSPIARLALSLLIIAFLLLAPPSKAQQPSEPPQSAQLMESYEGQTISALEVAGRPDLDSEKLLSMLHLKQGDKFSAEMIRRSIAELKQAGNFEDVELELRPETEGVRVMLVVQPAVYVGVFEFPGAGTFSYSRLLQISNYTAQEPYSKVNIDRAVEDLTAFFRRLGYFLAEVRPELKVEAEHGIANVLFHTTLGRRAKFGEVDLQGATPEQTAELQRKLRSFMARIRGTSIRPGKTYTYRRIMAATRYMKGALAKRGRLGATVELVSANYNPETNRADLTFHITPGPKVKVSTKGAHLWPWTRQRLLPVYQEGSIDEELIQEGERNLVSHFESKGYFDVQVRTDVQQQNDTRLITYTITKGERNKVQDVAVSGNSAFSDEKLLSHSTVTKGRFFFQHGKYSDQVVRKSVDNLEAVYKNAGYSDVKVRPRAERRNGDIFLTFHVSEGVRDVVDRLEIVGNNTVPANELAPGGLKLGAGLPYSQQLVDEDRSAVMARYLTMGYLTANFTATVKPVGGQKHRLLVTYNIYEGPRVETGEVITVGRQHSDISLVKRAADIKSGRPMSENTMLRSESELYTIDAFDWAQVDPKRPITDQSEEDVLIKVHESKRNSISYGFGFEVTNRGGSIPSGTVAVPGLPPVGLPSGFRTSQKTFVGPRGSFEYTRRNLRGTAESATFAAFAGRLNQRLSAIYTDPFFRGSGWTASATISGEHDSQNPVFTSRQGRASVQFQKYLDAAKTKSAYLRYNFQLTSLSRLLIADLVPAGDRRVRLSTFSGSFVRDTRDNLLDAHRGRYESIELGINTKILGSGYDFIRFLGQESYYREIGAGIVWANSVRLGLEQAFNGSHVPVSEKFFSGGGSTLRGFPLNGAGPQQNIPACGDPADPSTCQQVRVPTGGNQLVILNSEFRIPFPIKKGLSVVPFYDGGNVFPIIGFHTGEGNPFSHTLGLGLRYATPVGPVRIDVGHNLNAPAGIKATQIFITLGQAF